MVTLYKDPQGEGVMKSEKTTTFTGTTFTGTTSTDQNLYKLFEAGGTGKTDAEIVQQLRMKITELERKLLSYHNA